MLRRNETYVEGRYGMRAHPAVAVERDCRIASPDCSASLAGLVELYGGREDAFGKARHRATFDDCFALVKERWADEPDAAGYLDYIYEVEQRRNNLMLHASPTAFRQTITSREDGSRQLNRAGPDAYWRRALNYGCGGFYLPCES